MNSKESTAARYEENKNHSPRVFSGPSGFPPASDSLMDHAMHAVHHSREGGVYEPFLRHEAFTEAGLQIMGCQGYVGVHRDSEELPEWSYHLILNNSGYIVKHPDEEISLMFIQPVGTLVRLNVRRRHTLTADYRSPNWHGDELCDDGDWYSYDYGWASLHFGSEKKLGFREALDELLRRIAKLEDLAPDLFPEPMFPAAET